MNSSELFDCESEINRTINELVLALIKANSIGDVQMRDKVHRDLDYQYFLLNQLDKEKNI